MRRAREGDLEQIRSVFVEAARAGWAGQFPAEALAGFWPPLDWWRPRLERGSDTTLLVAEDHGRVVGFSEARPSADADASAGVGELHTLYTHPAVWGRGYGRVLLEASLDELRHRGCSQATLWTAEANDRPRRIYARGGWRADGARRTKTFLDVPYVEVRYRLDL